MDELIHHCIREISFDGDLGCDVSRLKQFIDDFYNKADAAPKTPKQNVDPSFRSFIWSLILQEPSITVGLVPEGSAAVYIAPQPSAIRKKKNGPSSSPAKASSSSIPTSLEPLPDDEVRTSPLEQLVERHGVNKLRIAVDHGTSLAAITGSHSRPAKLSPMVYTCLQFVTRSREQGIQMTDLGEATGYDQKTIHYLVTQLLELDLVHKVRIGGKSKHACIHKYFYEQSVFYQAETKKKAPRPTDGSGAEDVDQESDSGNGIATDRMDPLHPVTIGDRQLVRTRVIKFLTSLPDHLYRSDKLINAIGYYNADRALRRSFSTAVRGFIKEGWLEKVWAPHLTRRGERIACFHLTAEAGKDSGPSLRAAPTDTPEDDAEGEEDENRPLASISMHHQVVKLVEESGTTGTTMNDLAARLGSYDRRSLDQLLVRYERTTLPPHIADLAVIQMLETVKREHRHKYYTVPNYRSMIAAEGLPESSDKSSALDISRAGQFAIYVGPQFYGSGPKGIAELHEYTDDVASGRTPKIGQRDTSSRPNKGPANRKPKPGKRINPLGEDGRPVQGRPRNEWRGGKSKKQSINPRKPAPDALSELQTEPAPPAKTGEDVPSSRKRGRKRKFEDEKAQKGSPTGAEVVHTAQGDLEIQQFQPNKRKKSHHGEPDQSNSQPLRAATSGAAIATVVERFILPAASTQLRQAPSPTGSIPQPQRETQNVHCADKTGDCEALRDESAMDLVPNPVLAVVTRTPSFHSGDSLISRAPYKPQAPEGQAPVPEHPHSNPSVPSGLRGSSPYPGQKRPRSTSPEQPGVGGKKRAREESEEGMTEARNATNIEADAKPHFIAPRGMGVNVSYMRREKEILRLLKDAGGIVMNGVELAKGHMELLSELEKEGTPASAPPGTLLDKRTLETLAHTMEDRHAIKVLKTTVVGAGGQSRPVTIFYLPATTQEDLQQYLKTLPSKLYPNSKLGAPTKRQRVTIQGTSSESKEKRRRKYNESKIPVNQLTELSPLDLRADFVLDNRVASQLFGFIPGRFMRARELHLYTVSRIAGADATLSYVTSPGDGIIETPYFVHELPVGILCSVISTRYSPELEEFLRKEGGRETKLKDLPSNLFDALEISKARTRAKVVELLKVLTALRLLTPLAETNSATPHITCTTKESKSLSLEPVNIFDQPSSNAMEIQYWQLSLVAPIYGFGRLEKLPVLLGHVAVATLDEAVEYWRIVKDAALNQTFELQDHQILEAVPYSGPVALSPKIWTQIQNWRMEYRLTSRQISYLNLYVNFTTGSIPVPINPEDPNDPFNVLCFATAAPSTAVKAHLQGVQKKILLSLCRLTEPSDPATKDNTMRREGQNSKSVDAHELLARKAKEAKERLEQDWREMVMQIHPQALTEEETNRPSLVRIRKSFMASGGNVSGDKLRSAIQNALGAKPTPGSSKKLPVPGGGRKHSKSKTPAPAPSKPPPPTGNIIKEQTAVSSQGQKAIMDLIAMQEPVTQRSRSQKKKAKEPPEEEILDNRQRRQRFPWNDAMDELAQDASAVVGARCRSRGRMDWQPMSQVFPGLDSNGVRQRIMRLREDPAAEAYLLRLEQAWYKLWVANRGSEALPDTDPESSSNFDLVLHIAYLRRTIDKSSLRAGDCIDTAKVEERDLPSSTNVLQAQFRAVEEGTEDHWDMLWNGVGDEPREKGLLKESFVEDLSVEPTNILFKPGAENIAEAAIKMMLETPEKDYDADVAADMLKSCGQVQVAKAIENMQSDDLITRVISDPAKRAPGRTWRFQDWQQNAMQGPIPPGLVYDARGIVELVHEDSETEWSYVATGGEMAALLELVSEDKVGFSIDTSGPAARRPELDGNSKRVADDQLETSILLRLRSDGSGKSPEVGDGPLPPPSAGLSQQALVGGETSSNHGGVDGSRTACAAQSGPPSLVNCEACLADSAQLVLAGFADGEEKAIADEILAFVEGYDEVGVTDEQLQMALTAPPRVVHSIVRSMTHARIPLMFWSCFGGEAPLLISSRYLRKWTVVVHSDPIRLVFPRRWLDITGETIPHVWANGVRNVVGWIMTRPGITLYALRQRLRKLFDKPEVTALAQYLCDQGIINAIFDSTVIGASEGLTRSLDSLADSESKGLSFTLNQAKEKKWYELVEGDDGIVAVLKNR